jgi:hypothetical protein
VNYIVDGDSVVFRTAEGSKLTELTINDDVLFEVDEYSDTDAWSVVIRGHAHRLTTADEVRAADELGLRPWIPTVKYNYVRVRAASVSGRDFRRGRTRPLRCAAVLTVRASRWHDVHWTVQLKSAFFRRARAPRDVRAEMWSSPGISRSLGR